MTPPSSSKVDALVRRLHEAECGPCVHGDTGFCTEETVRDAILAALELAAETVEWSRNREDAVNRIRSLTTPESSGSPTGEGM